MIYIDKTGKRFNPFARHTVDGVTYDGNILKFSDVVDKLGIQQVPIPLPPNDYITEHYFTVEQDEAPYIYYERKSEEEIARIEQEKLNRTSLAYLVETDWQVIRAIETGTEIPEDIKQKRQAARNSIIHFEEK
jgi:hypothetical protein